MSKDDEIRGLKRELASTAARTSEDRTNAILAELEARGVSHPAGAGVEKRGAGRSKKNA